MRTELLALVAELRVGNIPDASHGRSNSFSTEWRIADAITRILARNDGAQEAVAKLDAPARIGNTNFGKGVGWETVIGRAKREHCYWLKCDMCGGEKGKHFSECIHSPSNQLSIRLPFTSMVCELCEADRSKEPCRRPHAIMDCPMIGKAQSATQDASAEPSGSEVQWMFGPTDSLSGVRIYPDGAIFDPSKTIATFPSLPNGATQNFCKSICDAHNAAMLKATQPVDRKVE